MLHFFSPFVAPGVSCKSSEPHPASVHLARDDEESTPRAGRAARTAARGGDLNPGSVGHPEAPAESGPECLAGCWSAVLGHRVGKIGEVLVLVFSW